MSFFNSGPSGFYNAPVSKTIFILTLGVTLAGSLIGTRKGGANIFGFGNVLPVITDNGVLQLIFPQLNNGPSTKYQFWRLLTGNFALVTMGELIFGSMLIYLFRLFERHWGSHKYLVFSIYSIITTFLLQMGSSVLLGTRLHSGPYGLIFACLAQYVWDIPQTNNFSIGNLTFSEKVFIYLLGIQMAMSSFPNSLIAAACGFICGIIYRSDVIRIKSIRFPGFLARFCTRYILPIIQGTRRRTASRRNQTAAAAAAATLLQQRQDSGTDNVQGAADTLLGDNDNYQQQQLIYQLAQFQNQIRQQQGQAAQGASTVQQPASPTAQRRTSAQPSEENIQVLQGMGFGRDESIQALNATNNNVEGAVSLLLERN